MTLSDKLKQHTTVHNHNQRGHGRYAFITKRSEIKQALEDGYTAKEVWALLHKKGVMPVQYRTFIDYVNRYLKQSEQAQPRATKPTKRTIPKKASTEVKPLKSQFTRRFEFNAKGKRKEELI